MNAAHISRIIKAALEVNGYEVLAESSMSGFEEEGIIIKAPGDGLYAGYAISVRGLDDEEIEE